MTEHKPQELRFCPRCAGDLVWRAIQYPEALHPACVKCGFVLWQNRKASVEALIIRGSAESIEVLLGRRKSGDWDLPGGFLDAADTIENTLIRECRREMNVQVEVGEIMGVFEDLFLGIPIVSLVYVCSVRSGTPQPSDPIDAIDWFPLKAPPSLAFLAVEQAISALQRRHGIST